MYEDKIYNNIYFYGKNNFLCMSTCTSLFTLSVDQHKEHSNIRNSVCTTTERHLNYDMPLIQTKIAHTAQGLRINFVCFHLIFFVYITFLGIASRIVYYITGAI